MHHGGGNNDYGYTNYQQSNWQTSADDDYFRETFHPSAHQDHPKYPAYGGWQTSPNEDYYQVVRTETVKTVESPMFPHQLNTLIDETVRVEGNNSFRRPVPEAHEQVYSSFRRPVPEVHEQVYTSFRRPDQHVPKVHHEQVYHSVHRPDQHVPKAHHEQVYHSVQRPEKHAPKAHEQVHVKKHVHFVQDGKEGKKENTYDENVDTVADDYIKRKHKKFDLSKLLSMRSQ